VLRLGKRNREAKRGQKGGKTRAILALEAAELSAAEVRGIYGVLKERRKKKWPSIKDFSAEKMKKCKIKQNQ